MPSPDDSATALERARRAEREAAGRLGRLLRGSDELYAQAAALLTGLDASLQATRSRLRGMGYLAEPQEQGQPH